MLNKLKKVRLSEILGLFLFAVVVIPAFLEKLYLKVKHRELWLVCETKNTARDNGYIFYKYMKEQHPDIDCYYAISKKSADYKKVCSYGNIVKWGSLKHYFYYMSATKNISSHKEGNPNHALFTVLHLYLKLYNNRVFLQHGVLYQNFPMFYKKNTKFKLFITGAKPEYDYVKEKYGYDNEVKYTGLARFDNLHDFEVDNKSILLIPTWRRWLDHEDKLQHSEYFKRLNSLINNKKLEELLEKYDKYLYFYLHLSMQKFVDLYKTNNERIRILDANQVHVQDLLKSGALLITDFSSIFTDFAYMYKPIIYYQYDINRFYQEHVKISRKDTYFDFKQNGFGYVVDNEEELVKKLEYYIKNNFKEEDIHKKRIDNFFLLHDTKNCERIFNEIIGVK